MCCNCRRPINCYNDKTRYKTMVFLYVVDIIFFIIRLGLISNDISHRISDTMGFVVPILLFDLIGSVPIIICNIIYVCMRHCIKGLIHAEQSLECLWHFATMTCIRLNCHNDHPQTILLIRIIIIIISFILKFICFIIGAACSARFQSQCTAYTVISAFALVSSIWIMVVEFVHFFRLWNYNPTETKNIGDKITVSNSDTDKLIERTHRRHLRFIHYSLLNEENVARFKDSRCQGGVDCKSQSLHHYLFYHSLESEHDIDFNLLTDDEKKSFIAFYQTDIKEALDVAKNGFPYGDNTNTPYKDYLHLKQTIVFTRSCKTTDNLTENAIICASLNLGRIKIVDNNNNLNLNEYFGYGDGTHDTVYVKDTRQLYLRMPDQIEKWIIVINSNAHVDDTLDKSFYQPCL